MSINYYERNADTFIAQTAEVDMSALRERFCRHLPSGAVVLDAGCGSGRDALAFSRLGYEVTAFDASPKMAAAARQRAGIPVFQMRFEDMRFELPFDGIWACASLLHVPRTQLLGVLEHLASFLKSKGVLYASFKYGDKERNIDNRYFNDLNEALLMQLLRFAPSLKLLEMWVTTDKRPNRGDERWLNCILERSSNAV